MAKMDARGAQSPYETPRENFQKGLLDVDLPTNFGTPQKGKVRNSWIVDTDQGVMRVLVTTDRQSAYDRFIGTTPGKGQVLNMLSSWWFDFTKDITPNHKISVPHPNVLIAKQAVATLPVEVVVRGYMAKSSTSTSVYDNYVNKGRRNIYGIDFPNGIGANEQFPMGPIVTPTTKSDEHDQELNDSQARDIVDSTLGNGIWQQAKSAALEIFSRSNEYALTRGLILADTKYEFGLDSNGDLMLIDEINTPDSSRYWMADTYHDRLQRGESPHSLDKEILRRWLSEHGFKGQGPVPVVDQSVIDQMSEAYKKPFELITGLQLPPQASDPMEVRNAILSNF